MTVAKTKNAFIFVHLCQYGTNTSDNDSAESQRRFRGSLSSPGLYHCMSRAGSNREKGGSQEARLEKYKKCSNLQIISEKKGHSSCFISVPLYFLAAHSQTLQNYKDVLHHCRRFRRRKVTKFRRELRLLIQTQSATFLIVTR